jgi:hypothetical protein
MTMHDLIEKLKARPMTPEEQRDEQKREWLGALRKLYTDIESWVRPAVAEGVLKTSRSEIEIVEQDFGEYMAPLLEIRAGGLTIRFLPVGARVVGVVATGGHRLVGLRGRVDLECGPIRIPLVRAADNQWKALPLRGEPRELNEEAFTEILSEVLDE